LADLLAKSGLELEQHYAQFQCTPSRAALMTSRERERERVSLFTMMVSI
jgi:arylsulfatase A-like enzyme